MFTVILNGIDGFNYETLAEAIEGAGRLARECLRCYAVDGVEREVTIQAFDAPVDEEDEEEEEEDVVPQNPTSYAEYTGSPHAFCAAPTYCGCPCSTCVARKES